MNIFRNSIAFLILFLSSLSFAEKKQPQFILHFDVNKTILADDPAGDKSIDDVLIACLAEKYTDIWDPLLLKNRVSYTTYVKEYLLPGKKSDKELKKLRNQKISEFISFLKNSDNSLYPIVKNEFELLKDKLENHKSILFNSFYQLIYFLNQHSIHFTIVLRTFGDDLNRVMNEANSHLKMPFFNQSASFKQGNLYISNKNLDSITAIYEFLKTTAHIGIQDNWKEWNDHNEAQEYAKRFPIDLSDSSTICMFFDDNVELDPSSITNIVNPIEVQTGKSLSVKDLIEANHIIVVDTINAILDDNYYINKVMTHLKD
jgi:plasmid maintenance system killer protein